MKRVLILEDDETLVNFYTMWFEGRSEVVLFFASSRKEAGATLFFENFDFIVCDGMLKDGFSGPLVEWLAQGPYKGRMIANSATHQDELCRLGCTFIVDEKQKLPQFLLNLLKT